MSQRTYERCRTSTSDILFKCIIQTLEITFGRLEFIISTVIEGRFKTHLPFPNLVENLVTTSSRLLRLEWVKKTNQN